MGRKLILGAIAIISVAAMAGVGFATYTASATANVNVNAGSFYLWESGVVSAQSLSSSAASCSPSAPSSAITLTVTNMLPGDFCNFTVTVTDPGSLAGNSPAGYYEGCSGGCSQTEITAAWIGPYGPLAAESGSADTYLVHVVDVGTGLVAESSTYPLLVTDTPA